MENRGMSMNTVTNSTPGKISSSQTRFPIPPFNIVAALAFADGSTGAKIFYHFAKGAYSVLGSFAIPALIGAIVLRIILKKKKAENPYFKDSVDDFNVY